MATQLTTKELKHRYGLESLSRASWNRYLKLKSSPDYWTTGITRNERERPPDPEQCPFCNGNKFIRKGSTYNSSTNTRYWKWVCLSCNKGFSSNTLELKKRGESIKNRISQKISSVPCCHCGEQLLTRNRKRPVKRREGYRYEFRCRACGKFTYMTPEEIDGDDLQNQTAPPN